MNIKSLDRPLRLPERMAEALTREISEGRLNPGDRLPTEQYLANNFGVSRNVVREAIAQLRSAGLVSSRQGLGTIVAEPEPKTAFQSVVGLGDDTSQFHHVYEFRLAIEPQAAALAARRGTAPQLAAISLSLDHLREPERWESEGVDLDIAFHCAVARASGNPFMAETIVLLVPRMYDTIAVTRRRSGRVVGEIASLTLVEHAAIGDAILSRDAEAARATMLDHITNAAHRLGYDLTRKSDITGP